MELRGKAKEATVLRHDLVKLCALQAEEAVQASIWSGCTRHGAEAIVSTLIRCLPEAEIILWSLEMYNTAIRGAVDAFEDKPIPGEMSDLRPTQLIFLTDGTMGFSNKPGGFGVPPRFKCDTLILIPAFGDFDGLLPVYLFAGPPRGDLSLKIRTVGPMRPGENARSHDVIPIALRKFMGLRLAARSPVTLPSADRRMLKRREIPLPDISVVHLRRRDPSEWHTDSNREYRHRWIVKGHWRRLHEPRKKDGVEVTYVDSYVKGPDGAPLLPVRETVYAVTR